jgi:prepilin-type N-terminal cleavage/methylation domain-containing protein
MPLKPRKNAGSPFVRRAFTLVEISIAVVVLAIVAVAVVPLLLDTASSTTRQEFVAELRSFVSAADMYRLRYGHRPEDASTGVVPTNLAQYLDASAYEDGTPLGGEWDFELNSFNITSGVGVHFRGVTVPATAEMEAVDALIDDGNLNTGRFLKLASDRFYFVIEQ